MPVHVHPATPILVTVLTLLAGGCAPPDESVPEPTASRATLIDRGVDPVDWRFEGATFPSEGGVEVTDYLTESFDHMEAMNMDSIRLRGWHGWTTGALDEVLAMADARGVSVAIILSHKVEGLSFIEGYPDDIQLSRQGLRALLPLADQHPSVRGFDVRAEPFKKSLHLDPGEENIWMETIAGDIQRHNPAWRVFTNLMETSLEHIPEVSGWSDSIVVNYYFPRGKRYNGVYIPGEVYEAEMPRQLEAFMAEVRSYNTENKPVSIGQLGAYIGHRDDKPYTDEAGQAAWYRVFLASIADYPEVIGLGAFVLAGAEKGFALVDVDGTCKLACDEIAAAYGATE